MGFLSILKTASLGLWCLVQIIHMLENLMLLGLCLCAITHGRNHSLLQVIHCFLLLLCEMCWTLLLDPTILLLNMLGLGNMSTKEIFERNSSSLSTIWKFLFDCNK